MQTPDDFHHSDNEPQPPLIVVLSAIAGGDGDGDGLARLPHDGPEVVVMDYRLPRSPHHARRHRPQPVAIVFLTGAEDFDVLYDAIDAGAIGFLIRSTEVDAVADILRDATAGEVLLPPRVLTAVISEDRTRLRTDGERQRLLRGMSPRELEVLRLMADGFCNRSIAAMLGVSYTTARAHVRSILYKLDAHSRLQAVALAAELELLPG